MTESATISDMACEEEPESLLMKTRQLFTDAQLLLRELEEMFEQCASIGPSNQGQQRKSQQECHVDIEEHGETLVIGGFRFECAASREELRRMSPQAAAGRHQGST